ncbi:hypothetical protein PR048_026310 [Dryococelus australis]|uniref:Uncharacterized protein n=1 Tax=Dryococelus australis TaxID=614101 RepID=A0ABQ9GL20_9NEOP|nr:hypothetical protein PR048_026310 [Dryococelus australis]
MLIRVEVKRAALRTREFSSDLPAAADSVAVCRTAVERHLAQSVGACARGKRGVQLKLGTDFPPNSQCVKRTENLPAGGTYDPSAIVYSRHEWTGNLLPGYRGPPPETRACALPTQVGALVVVVAYPIEREHIHFSRVISHGVSQLITTQALHRKAHSRQKTRETNRVRGGCRCASTLRSNEVRRVSEDIWATLKGAAYLTRHGTGASEFFVEPFFVWDFKQRPYYFADGKSTQSVHFDIRQSENAVFSYVERFGNSGINIRSFLKATFHHHLKFVFFSEVLRANEGSAEMKGRRETGDPGENLLNSGIVRHDSHLRNSGNGPTGD